jgi:pimeloyl-ACP methyl ester carboxylesterase
MPRPAGILKRRKAWETSAPHGRKHDADAYWKISEQWPEPQRFPQFLDKMGKMLGASYDWSAEVKELPMPVMLVFADNDSVSPKHIAEFFALLGGGVKEPGWQNTQLSKARLAIVPGYSHYNFVSAPELAPIINKYLADPLTTLPADAASERTTFN